MKLVLQKYRHPIHIYMKQEKKFFYDDYEPKEILTNLYNESKNKLITRQTSIGKSEKAFAKFVGLMDINDHDSNDEEEEPKDKFDIMKPFQTKETQQAFVRNAFYDEQLSSGSSFKEDTFEDMSSVHSQSSFNSKDS